MRYRYASLALVLGTIGMVALGGCRFGPGQPTRLYVLTPISSAAPPSSARGTPGVAIGVGPIELPPYADRLQMVTGNTSAELHTNAYEQWAEPLRDSFSRVLAENLSLLLVTDRVVLFPWRGPQLIEYQVLVKVMHFLGELGGETSLIALWSIVDKNGQEVLTTQRSSFREPTGSQGYGDLAAAMSRTVAALSHDIAAAIATLKRPASQRQ